MTKPNQRSYNCKDEDLPAICSFALISLKRDQADFMAFSPKFNPEFITGFEASIDSVNEIAMPKTETLALKKSTELLYETMEGLIDPINRVSGYLSMAKPVLKMSAADFGLTQLRKDVNSRNAEGTVSKLHTLSANLSRYATELSAQGLTPELSGLFTTAAAAIETENEQQYQILSSRKSIVQNNLNLFNGLNEQLVEILRIGKILYKATNPVKAQEYNFTALKKKVSSSARTIGEPTLETPAA